MSFYNGILNHDDNHESSQGGKRGLPGIGYKLTSDGDYDIENKILTNVKLGDADNDVMVKNQIEGYVSNKTQYIDDITPGQVKSNKAVIYSNTGSIHSNSLYLKDQYGQETIFHNEDQDDNQIRLYIPNLKNNDSFGGRLKSSIMVTSIDQTIEGKNIFHDIEVPTPIINGHASNKAYVDNEISKLSDATDDCANKKYVDSQISKANIKPSHTPKNVFKYLMDDVNEWSSEYNIKVLSFSYLDESPHSWDKRVLNIIPVKDGKNYRFRLGLQMFPMKTNETYSLIVELYNRDFKTWGRQETYVEATGIWLKSHNTTKFQHQYGSSGDLYYSKTLIKFKKTSSSAPVFIYYTVHFDDRGGDMNTYPLEFKNQVYILAYGIVGETDHVDNRVYDEYQAFEIDKTKMKMLVPLDLNNKKIINISNDSDVTKINLYGMVDKRRFFTAFSMPIEFNKVRIVNIKLLNTIKTRSKKDVINFYITSSSIIKFPFTFPDFSAYIYIQINNFFDVINYIKLVNTVDIPFQITYDVFY